MLYFLIMPGIFYTINVLILLSKKTVNNCSSANLKLFSHFLTAETVFLPNFNFADHSADPETSDADEKNNCCAYLPGGIS